MKSDRQRVIDALAEIIWNYLLVKQRPEKSDLIFVLCSIDLRVAEYAVALYKDKLAPKILFSGGRAHKKDLLATKWNKSEAEKFAEYAIRKGLDNKDIFIEPKATNTGENIKLSYSLLKRRKIKTGKIILVQKPYMTRRTMSAFLKQWPDKETKFFVTCQNVSFNDYCKRQNKDKIINIMIGDLQRVIIYPRIGYQTYQKVPEKVMDAYRRLIGLGFNGHLLESIKK